MVLLLISLFLCGLLLKGLTTILRNIFHDAWGSSADKMIVWESEHEHAGSRKDSKVRMLSVRDRHDRSESGNREMRPEAKVIPMRHAV